MKAANKNTIPITSESDILCAFRNLTSSYDERTLHKWINFFKKCMYYASSDYSNPMFLSLTYNAVKKSEQYPYEFLYIHKLMYQFLCLRTPCFLQFPPYTDLASEYDRTAIKWNVPAPITPFLICYIKAARKFKNALSLHFSMNLTRHLQRQKKNFKTIYSKQNIGFLTDEILCRNIFVLRKKFIILSQKNDSQKEALRHCIFHLTETLTAILQKQPPQKNYSAARLFVYIFVNTFRKII